MIYASFIAKITWEFQLVLYNISLFVACFHHNSAGQWFLSVCGACLSVWLKRSNPNYFMPMSQLSVLVYGSQSRISNLPSAIFIAHLKELFYTNSLQILCWVLMISLWGIISIYAKSYFWKLWNIFNHFLLYSCTFCPIFEDSILIVKYSMDYLVSFYMFVLCCLVIEICSFFA